MERVGELREALNDNPTGKTSGQALVLRAQVEELAQTVEHQQQAMMEAYRNGTLTGDELHDLMDYTNEATASVGELRENAGRQTARANGKGTWVDVVIGFNPVIGGLQLLEEVGDGIRSGQYGQAMLPVLLDSTPIGRSLGSMVNKVFGGFKKPKRVDRDSSSSTNDTSTNQRESAQDNDGLRVEENGAANRASHEEYKTQLRRQMSKPSVSDPELSEVVDELYRPNATIGSGSTADAIRHELATGQAVGGRMHSQKGLDSIRFLNRWLDRNPNASLGDRAAAENIIMDLRNALVR